MALLRRRREGYDGLRPVVVLPDAGPSAQRDPLWSPQALRRQVELELAETWLAAAKSAGAPLADVVHLATQVRTARLDHAEALLVAGAHLPDDVLRDLAARGAAPHALAPRPAPRPASHDVAERA